MAYADFPEYNSLSETCNTCRGTGIVTRQERVPTSSNRFYEVALYCSDCNGNGRINTTPVVGVNEIEQALISSGTYNSLNNYSINSNLAELPKNYYEDYKTFCEEMEKYKPKKPQKRDIVPDLEQLAKDLSIALKKVVYGSKEEKSIMVAYLIKARGIKEFY